jgi:hypothetical protein
MRLTTMLGIGMLSVTSTVSASPVLTPCTGSWDGPGLSACELIGRPGIIAQEIDYTLYDDPTGVLWSITGRPNGTLRREGNAWMYENGYDVFSTNAHPNQFAVWEDEFGIILGVEDLTAGDWDYNDYVVRMQKAPTENVPEPGSVALLAAAFIAALRKFWK